MGDVNQKHSGSGDNVFGNKIINYKIPKYFYWVLPVIVIFAFVLFSYQGSQKQKGEVVSFIETKIAEVESISNALFIKIKNFHLNTCALGDSTILRREQQFLNNELETLYSEFDVVAWNWYGVVVEQAKSLELRIENIKKIEDLFESHKENVIRFTNGLDYLWGQSLSVDYQLCDDEFLALLKKLEKDMKERRSRNEKIIAQAKKMIK